MRENLDDNSLERETQHLAGQLGSLQPAPCRLSRDELMFLAGQQSVTRVDRSPAGWRNAGWLVAAAALLCAAVAWHPAVRPQRVELVERVVYRDPQPAAPSTPAIAVEKVPDRIEQWVENLVNADPSQPVQGTTNYVTIRNAALKGGLDALPPIEVTDNPGMAPRSHLRWRQLMSLSGKHL